MAIERGGGFKGRLGRMSIPSTPAWLQPLPSGPVRFDPTLLTARQLMEISVRLHPSAIPDDPARVSGRAA